MKPREKEQLINSLVDELFRYDPETGKIYNKIKRHTNIIIGKESGFTCSTHGYRIIKILRLKYRAHRIAWRLYYGIWPKHEIDHINGIRADNRICNLRDIEKRKNDLNKFVHRKGKLFGCHFCKTENKFRAEIYVNHIKCHLGYFETEIEAHEQYLKALKSIEKREFKSAKELREYIKKMK